MKRFLLEPIDDLASCLERQLLDNRRRARAVALAVLAAAVTWFVYVPVHELLHVAGCELTGGDVTELQLSRRYGAAMLSRVFPFIVPAEDYAGRVTGFDTKGSDLIYLATDIAPFLLSVFIGVPLLKHCTRRRRPVLWGPALILGLAPILNLTGDYFEMGSIVTSRIAGLVSGTGTAPAYAGIRSDDIFRLIESMAGESSETPEFALASGESKSVAAILVGVSAAVAVLFALATYRAGAWFSRIALGRVADSSLQQPPLSG